MPIQHLSVPGRGAATGVVMKRPAPVAAGTGTLAPLERSLLSLRSRASEDPAPGSPLCERSEIGAERG